MSAVRRKLFLTGPIGCGKSTAISRALGERISLCGGFLTRRKTGEGGSRFTIDSPDGRISQVFLSFCGSEPCLELDSFEAAGISLMKGRVLVLDEIGGVELLSAQFSAALEKVLESDIPVIGVLKSAESARILAGRLGMEESYLSLAAKLRERLCSDENTTVYECGQFDKKALELSRSWAEEYL